MPDNTDIHSLKTDIALIQKDVRQMESGFQRVESAVSQMSGIFKTIAVQENVLGNSERKISSLEESFKKSHSEQELFRKELGNKLEDMRDTFEEEREKRHKELLQSIEKLNQNMNSKFDKQDQRIRSLENWRWYLLGIGAILLFILNKLPWAAFFGG